MKSCKQIQTSFDALRAPLIELGFDISKKKVLQPATRVTCLGVDIDTVEFTVSITPDKVTEILSECVSWVEKNECTSWKAPVCEHLKGLS